MADMQRSADGRGRRINQTSSSRERDRSKAATPRPPPSEATIWPRAPRAPASHAAAKRASRKLVSGVDESGIRRSYYKVGELVIHQLFDRCLDALDLLANRARRCAIRCRPPSRARRALRAAPARAGSPDPRGRWCRSSGLEAMARSGPPRESAGSSASRAANISHRREGEVRRRVRWCRSRRRRRRLHGFRLRRPLDGRGVRCGSGLHDHGGVGRRSRNRSRRAAARDIVEIDHRRCIRQRQIGRLVAVGLGCAMNQSSSDAAGAVLDEAVDSADRFANALSRRSK